MYRKNLLAGERKIRLICKQKVQGRVIPALVHYQLLLNRFISYLLSIIRIMATAVASRFAVLSMDDDDDFSSRKKQIKKKDESKQANTTKASSLSQQKNNDSKNKKNNKLGKKKPDGSGQQQPSANGSSKPKKPKSKKEAGMSEEQWEEWKKKDQEFVSDSYEQDLHEAVLQSKLEFEQQRKLRAAAGLDPPGGKGSRKRGKPQTMSLEQFNNPQQLEEEPEKPKGEELAEEDRLFFEKVNEDARLAINLELRHEQVRVREPYVQEAVTIAQFQDMLEKRNDEILILQKEVSILRDELLAVRGRNSQLCTILAQGEMKEKVGVLLEMERLKAVREELLNEVQSLHVQLEQERSKVHALTAAADPKKNKGKKKTVSESTQ